MYQIEPNIRSKLSQLSIAVNNLIDFFEQDLEFTEKVNTYWTAKDILGHITFWHESFARNLKDLDNCLKPSPLKGKLSEVNQQSVESTRSASIRTLVNRLEAAQKIIDISIFNTNVSLIPYKKGSRSYSRAEHLDIVSAHINKHLKNLKKHYKS